MSAEITILMGLLIVNLASEEYLLGSIKTKNTLFVGAYLFVSLILLHSSMIVGHMLYKFDNGDNVITPIGSAYLVEFTIAVILGWVMIFASEIIETIKITKKVIK